MSHFQILAPAYNKADRVRLAREIQIADREYFGEDQVVRESAEIPGLKLVRKGRHISFQYQGAIVRYFIRYAEFAATLSGSSLATEMPPRVQRYINAKLEEYWQKLNEKRAAS